MAYDDTGWFGSKIAKAVGKAAKGVAKVAAAPVTHAVSAASAIAHGQNIGKSLVNYVKADLATVKQVAPYVQTVASFVPGIGTLVSVGIGGVSAAMQGKSITEIGKSMATGAIPGGPIVAAVAMTAANAVAAGVQGQNIAKAAANELVSHAANMIPSPQLAQVLKDATRDALNGKNVLRSVKGAAIQQAIAQIPDGAARDAARAVVSGKSPAQVITAGGAKLLGQVAAKGSPATASLLQTVQVAAKQVPPSLTVPVRQVNMRPTLAPSPRAARPALPFRAPIVRSLQSPFSVPMGVIHRPVTGRARMFLVNRAGRIGRDVSGLTPDGKWLVQAGDTGSSIAKALTGNANRWTELKAANPAVMKKASAADIAKYGFPMPYAGNVINLPAGWVTATVVPTPVPVSTPVPVPSGAPMGQPVPTVVLQNLPTVLAPSGDTAAQAQARVILAVWGKSDGAATAGLSDYGGVSEIGATSWSARDKLMAASFERWWNTSFRPSAPFVQTPGDWNQALADGLHTWSEAKAAQVLPGVTLPVPAAASIPEVTPAQTSNTIPASGGTPAIQLPGITITAPAQQPAQPAPQSSEPTGFAAWWTNNKGAAIPGLVGLAATIGAKYI